MMRLPVILMLALTAFVSGCGGGPDVDAARTFEVYPLYWLGTRFEHWDLDYIDVGNGEFSTFVYGTCEVTGPPPDPGGCSPPLQIQIQPLCAHLDVVARNQRWRQQRVRGAPLGTIDSAPVLFTDRVQIKIYRGQGSTRGVELRAFRALRSANQVEPVVGPREPFPPASEAVLSGTEACSS